MPDSPTYALADVVLNQDETTPVPRAALHGWIIWQFPRPRQGGLCAAVHPPVAGHGWLPAIVHAKARQVRIFGQVPPAASPETAVDYFATHPVP